MAKFYGKIGFSTTVKRASGIWEPVTVEKEYYGELLKRRHSWSSNGESPNDNLVISNVISVIADDYLTNNIADMRYVVWNGSKWEVKSITVNHPRIEITLGGVYSGQTTGISG